MDRAAAVRVLDGPAHLDEQVDSCVSVEALGIPDLIALLRTDVAQLYRGCRLG